MCIKNDERGGETRDKRKNENMISWFSGGRRFHHVVGLVILARSDVVLFSFMYVLFGTTTQTTGNVIVHSRVS